VLQDGSVGFSLFCLFTRVSKGFISWPRTKTGKAFPFPFLSFRKNQRNRPLASFLIPPTSNTFSYIPPQVTLLSSSVCKQAITLAPFSRLTIDPEMPLLSPIQSALLIRNLLPQQLPPLTVGFVTAGPQQTTDLNWTLQKNTFRLLYQRFHVLLEPSFQSAFHLSLAVLVRYRSRVHI